MVCTRVPGSRPDRRRQKVWQVPAAYHEVIALMDHLRCEGIQRLVLEIHERLLAHLVLPGRGGRAGGVAGQRPRCEAPARAGQERPGRLRVAVQAERAGDAAPLVRAAAGGPGPAGADPHPGPAGPGPGAAPGPGGEDPRRRAAEDLGGDLGPVRGQRAAVPGRPRRRGAQPRGAGRAGRQAAQGDPPGTGGRAHRPVPRHPRLRDQDAPADPRRDQRRDRPPGRGDRASSSRWSPAPRRPAPPAARSAAVTPPAAPAGHPPAGPGRADR